MTASPHFPRRLLLRQVRRTTRDRKYSPQGLILTRKKRYTGHATVNGLAFERHRAFLHPQKPPHPHRRHLHHVTTGHKRTHIENRTSAVHHQHRARTTLASLHESRHDAALKAAQTRRQRGEKTGFALLTPEQRHLNALKAATTRKREGIKPFGHESASTRHLAALRAAQTRKARGESAFRHMTASARSAAAMRAAATRRARHER